MNKVDPMFMYKLLLLHNIIGIMHFIQFYECVEILYKSKVLILRKELLERTGFILEMTQLT